MQKEREKIIIINKRTTTTKRNREQCRPYVQSSIKMPNI
jgi:hypothetical protein